MPDIDLSEEVKAPSPTGKTNHDHSLEAQGKRAGGDSSPLTIREAGAEFKPPESPAERRTAINDTFKSTVASEGVARTQDKTFTAADGTQMKGQLETTPDQRQYFNQVNADGTGKRYEVFTDNQGRQTMQPVDNEGRTIKTGGTVMLQSEKTAVTQPEPAVSHQRQAFSDQTDPKVTKPAVEPVVPLKEGQVTPEPATRRTAVASEVPVVVQPNPGVDTNPQGVRPVGQIQGKPEPVVPAVVAGNDNLNPDKAVKAQDPLLKASAQPHQFEQYRPIQQQQQQVERPVVKQETPLQGKVEKTDGPAPVIGQTRPDAVKPIEPVKPGEVPKPAEPVKPQLPPETLHGKDPGRPELAHLKPGDLQRLPQIDGKLLAQLQGLGRSPEFKGQLIDLLGKMQDGRALNPRESMMQDLLRGLKPEQLSGLQAWLKDPGRNQFDFKQLDLRSQQDLSKVFDSVMGKSLGDRGAGRLLELLSTDKSGKFDRIPSQEQSRTMLLELFKGMRDSQLAAGKTDLSLKDSLSLSRTMGGERGNTEFKLNLKELSPVMQLLLERMQNKDFLATGDRSGFISRMDGKELAFGQMKDQALGGKEVSSLRDLLQQQKDMTAREDGKIGPRLPEAVKDLVNKTELGRALGSKDQATLAAGDGSQHNTRIADGPESGKAKLDQQGQLANNELTAKKQQEELEEARKRKEDKDKDKAEQQKLLEEELLARQLREKQEREAKEKQKKLEEEEKKRKEEGQKKDDEYPYVVRKGDTLKSIAGRLLKDAALAEVIYDRNKASVMVSPYKGQQYARLFPGQKLIIPNQKYIQGFKSSFKSHKSINFDKIPYGSAEEELQAMLGKNWEGAGPAAGLLGKRLFGIKDAKDEKDDTPVTRRSFSGKGNLSDEERKANIQSAFGQMAAEAPAKYTVKLGEGFRSIAQKLYNKPAFWRLIAYKNGMTTDIDGKGNPLAQLRRGDQIVLPDAHELEAFDEDPEAYLRGEYGLESQFQPIDLQDLEISEDGSQSNPYAVEADEASYHSSETNEGTTQALEATDQRSEETDLLGALAPQFSADPSRVPEQGQTRVDLQEQTRTDLNLQSQRQPSSPAARNSNPMQKAGSGSGSSPAASVQSHSSEMAQTKTNFVDERDSIWIAHPEPVALDDFVQIIESEIQHGDTIGISVSLQMLAGGEWHTMYDYQIFPEECFIVQYNRQGARLGSTRKSLNGKQSKQMASNHFQSAWQSICREFWRS